MWCQQVSAKRATADAFTLIERLETKLEQYPDQHRACVGLAKDWRTDRYLAPAQAMLIARRRSFDLYPFRGRRRARARERHRGHRLGRSIRAGRRPCAGRFRPFSRGHRPPGHGHRRCDICVYTNRELTVEALPETAHERVHPREIVSELDQLRGRPSTEEAKRAVAIALRNRWRRQRVDADLRDEVTPKNILMIGPTGVGKTEIARRLARLAQAPFLKVEATKFTEVGYVGRDVDQIVRDLVEAAMTMVRERRRAGVKAKADQAAEERLLDALVGPGAGPATRESFRKRLRAGELDDKEVELTLADIASPMQGFEIPGQPGASMGVLNLSEIMGKAFGSRTKTHKTTVAGAWAPLTAEESDKLLDQDSLTLEAVDLAQQSGIVFIDEIDKVASRAERLGADVSREGVQRDLLPLIEGTTVATRYGPVKTDYISVSSPPGSSASLRARKPPARDFEGRPQSIRVELKALTRDDLRRMPANAIPGSDACPPTLPLARHRGRQAFDAATQPRRHRQRRRWSRLSLKGCRRSRCEQFSEKVVEDDFALDRVLAARPLLSDAGRRHATGIDERRKRRSLSRFIL